MYEKVQKRDKKKYPLFLPPEITLWVSKMHIISCSEQSFSARFGSTYTKIEQSFNMRNIFSCKKYHFILFYKYIIVYHMNVIIKYGTFNSKCVLLYKCAKQISLYMYTNIRIKFE